MIKILSFVLVVISVILIVTAFVERDWWLVLASFVVWKAADVFAEASS